MKILVILLHKAMKDPRKKPKKPKNSKRFCIFFSTELVLDRLHTLFWSVEV